MARLNVAEPNTGSFDFDVKREIENSKNRIKKGTLRIILILFVLLQITVLLASFFKYHNNPNATMFNDVTIAFMGIPFFYAGYLYMMERSRFTENIGSEVFVNYSKTILNKDVGSTFDPIDTIELAQKLSTLQGYVYSELKEDQKEIVLFATANKYYEPTWLFSDEVLRSIASANSNYHFHQIINNAKCKIKGKEKFIIRKINRVRNGQISAL